MPRVVLTDHNYPDYVDEQACATDCGAEFEVFHSETDAEVIAALAGADLAFVRQVPVSPVAVAGMCPNAVIVRYGVGVDNLPLEACAEHGVRVCNVPDYGMGEVAEHASSMLLALHRRLPSLDAHVRAGSWRAAEICSTVPGLSEITLGVLGCGRIGRELLIRMRAFGVRCIAHDPVMDDAAITAAGAQAVSIEELWQQADLISLHAPAIPATHHIVNAASIAQMKQGVIIINCARGELINEIDLAAALVDGKIAGAGLDVFSTEPLAADSPLREAPNVLLSPHAAWCSAQSVPRLQRLAAEEGRRALRGEPLRCEIVPDEPPPKRD